MKRYTRKELVQICKDAVIHHTKWEDRDSYAAQKEIQSIYKGLTAGYKFKILQDKNEDCCTDERTIWIEFIKPFNLRRGSALEISTREEYFRDCDPNHDTEMFEGYGIDFASDNTTGYMPTRERLDSVGKGNDWY